MACDIIGNVHGQADPFEAPPQRLGRRPFVGVG